MNRNTELFLPEGECIISKTDLKGNINYANKAFIELCGYSKKELMCQAHNIIRHDDMPQGVFRLMWDTIKRGNEFVGFVKNRCKGGEFYWVFATISPSLDDNGKTQGYLSVRRPPNKKVLPIISQLYQEMISLEKGQSEKTACQASINYLQSKLENEGVSYDEWAFKHQAG